MVSIPKTAEPKSTRSSFKKLLWGLGFLLLTQQAEAQLTADQKVRLIDRQMVPAIEELKAYVAIPNDAIEPANITKNIHWAEEAFRKRAFRTQVLQTTRLPLFYAEKSFTGATQTVLFYFHLDGQPVRSHEWNQKDPYLTVLKQRGTTAGTYEEIDWNRLQGKLDDEWRVFGRSTSDDKGPIIMLLQALDILNSEKQTPAFNVKVLLDTEEEKGSGGIRESLHKYSELAKTDVILVMDGPMHSSNLPTLTFGNRGGAGFTLTTYGALVQQHSGHYGNYSPDPSFRLAKIIASMKDEEGRVLIKGFYDGITLDEETKKLLAAVPDNREEINRRLVIAHEEKVGANYQESLQYPSLTIQGMQAAVVGKGGGTIIPHEAVASFGVRLVAESDGTRLIGLIKKHIADQGFMVLDHEPTIEERLKYPQIVYFKGGGGSPGYRTDVNSPYGKWLRGLFTDAYGKEPVVIRNMGGGVPTIPLVEAMKAPAILVPLVNLDNNQHSPNENLRLGNLRMGIKSCLAILSTPLGELAK